MAIKEQHPVHRGRYETVQETLKSQTGFQEAAITMALGLLVDRLRHLPKEDLEDLYELMKELAIVKDDAEELESVFSAMREILDQAPVHLIKMDLGQARPPRSLRNWIGFVSKMIKTVRKEAKMTQAELAEKSGLPQSHISRLESGKHSPSRLTLERIAVAAGVPLARLDPSILLGPPEE